MNIKLYAILQRILIHSGIIFDFVIKGISRIIKDMLIKGLVSNEKYVRFLKLDLGINSVTNTNIGNKIKTFVS